MKTPRNEKNAQPPGTAQKADLDAGKGHRKAMLEATAKELAVQWEGDPDPQCLCDICAEARTEKRARVEHQALQILIHAVVGEELLNAIEDGASIVECIETSKGRIRQIQAAAAALIDGEINIVRDDSKRAMAAVISKPSHD